MFAGKKGKTRREDKYKFITYILNKMKLPTEHRKTGKKDEERRLKRKAPRDLGPEDTIVHTRGEGPTVLLCGDSKVACKWINVEFAQGTQYKDIIGKIQRILHSWWKKRSSHTDLEHRQFCDERQQRT